MYEEPAATIPDNNITPEETVVLKLIERGQTISFAESCTGGMLPARLIGVANASKVINASVVTYSNEAKMKFAGVRAETIEAYDVVSEAVAAEMACGIAELNNADVAVSTTGYAGPGSDVIHICPDGREEVIPVGTVCFGFYINGTVRTCSRLFSGMTRNEVRERAADFVFRTLADEL